MNWTQSEQRRRVWWWVIWVAFTIYALSFFLPVAYYDVRQDQIVGWEAAWFSFVGMIDNYHHVSSWIQFDFWDARNWLWLMFAWIGNTVWVAYLVAIGVGPKRCWIRFAARMVVVLVAVFVGYGVTIEVDWLPGFWAWSGSIAVVSVAVWLGPRRAFARDHCQRCGYDLAGVPTCPECGREAGIVPA